MDRRAKMTRAFKTGPMRPGPSLLHSLILLAIFAEHIFHLDLLPTSTASSGTEAASILATERSVSRIERDGYASNSGAKLVTHARRKGKKDEPEEQWDEEQ
jgi:hypothetical protein